MKNKYLVCYIYYTSFYDANDTEVRDWDETYLTREEWEEAYPNYIPIYYIKLAG